MWVVKKRAHYYTLNLVTLSHFGRVFEGWPTSSPFEGHTGTGHIAHRAHKHISSSYTATIRHYKWPHQLIIETSTTPCHRTVRHHCSAMQWFPLPQSDHSPDITNASSQLSKDLLPLLFQPPKNLTPSSPFSFSQTRARYSEGLWTFRECFVQPKF